MSTYFVIAFTVVIVRQFFLWYCEKKNNIKENMHISHGLCNYFYRGTVMHQGQNGRISSHVLTLYIFIMFCIYPLYYENGYYDIGTVKCKVFLVVSVVLFSRTLCAFRAAERLADISCGCGGCQLCQSQPCGRRHSFAICRYSSDCHYMRYPPAVCYIIVGISPHTL